MRSTERPPAPRAADSSTIRQSSILIRHRKFPLFAALLAALCSQLAAAADLSCNFDTNAENWQASDAAATLNWESSGGMPGGHLRGSRSGSTNLWYFVSPTAWAGDWSSFQTIKFDLAIPSGHYPSRDIAGMVVIAGSNGMTMTWTGPTPLWTWTYYEVSVTPAAFGVDQATFDGIMAGVSELRILAEFVGGTETVGLDSVLVTTTPPSLFTADLRSTFTTGTTEGWGVVDDANLNVTDEGRPSWALYANDTQAGQTFKVASPTSWAGDWRNFTEIRFDLKWTSSSTNLPQGAILTLFGSGGQVVTWTAVPVRDAWHHYVVPLTPAAFGVDSNYFAGILRHVTKIWLTGEFNSGDDITWFDNITVGTGPHTPVIHTTSLASRFGSSGEGWVGYDNATFSWDATGGFLGSGAAKVVDAGAGTARFQSPDSWVGDWRAFHALRFMVHQNVASDYNAMIWIADFEGNVLQQTFTPPLLMWTPFTVDLTPEAFQVTPALFDTVMSNVACLWINSDLDTSSDTTWLDEVSMLPSAAPGAPPPDRSNTFDADAEGWLQGSQTSGGWASPSAVQYYYAATDNPPSCVVNADGGSGTTVFYSPENWTGDWRGFQSVAFDMNIIVGSQANVVDPGAMIWLVSPFGTLAANCTETPPIKAWKRYEFALNPVAFGVTPAEYDRIARDVVVLAIRSEWLSGTAEREAMDNVLVSTNPTPYWAWLDNYLSPAALLDPEVAATTADADHDGLNNWGEFIAGTNPTNAFDSLRIERVSIVDTNCLLEFNSRTGRLYSILGTPSLTASNVWTVTQSNIAGTGSILTVPSGGITSTRQFYRLQVYLSE
jgi:hypothetical protein